MAKFIVVRKQAGEGCDYSIGCGMCFDELSATTREGAVTEAKSVLEHDGWSDGGDDSETALEQALVVEVVEDVMPLVRARSQQRREEAATRAVQRKRDQIKKLQQEVGE